MRNQLILTGVSCVVAACGRHPAEQKEAQGVQPLTAPTPAPLGFPGPQGEQGPGGANCWDDIGDTNGDGAANAADCRATVARDVLAEVVGREESRPRYLSERTKFRTFRYASVDDYHAKEAQLLDPSEVGGCEVSAADQQQSCNSDDAPPIATENISAFVDDALTMRCPDGYMAVAAQCRGLVVARYVSGYTQVPSLAGFRSVDTHIVPYGHKFLYPNSTSGAYGHFPTEEGNWDGAEAEILYDSGDLFSEQWEANGAAIRVRYRATRGQYPVGVLCALDQPPPLARNRSGNHQVRAGYAPPGVDDAYGNARANWEHARVVGIGVNFDGTIQCLRVDD